MIANLLAVAKAQERKSAEVRREEILEAALVEFAHGGLHGTSTEDIADSIAFLCSDAGQKMNGKRLELHPL